VTDDSSELHFNPFYAATRHKEFYCIGINNLPAKFLTIDNADAFAAKCVKHNVDDEIRKVPRNKFVCDFDCVFAGDFGIDIFAQSIAIVKGNKTVRNIQTSVRIILCSKRPMPLFESFDFKIFMFKKNFQQSRYVIIISRNIQVTHRREPPHRRGVQADIIIGKQLVDVAYSVLCERKLPVFAVQQKSQPQIERDECDEDICFCAFPFHEMLLLANAF
jgi:hypothetical protein